MAAATLTATPFNSTMIRDPGVWAAEVSFDFNTGATKLGTASDAVMLAKIPSGVEITGMWIRYTTKSDTQQIARVDLLDASGTLLCNVIATFTVSATSGIALVQAGGAANSIPYKLSLSDDAALQYARLALVFVSGSETVSASLAGVVRYSRNSKLP